MSKDDLIGRVEQLFGNEPRPEHFTDYRHCCECAEHDATLQAHTPQTITLNELGSPAWDPVCFMTDAAFRYYFPALVRLALEGSGDTYYIDQFLFHLQHDGKRNRRWQAFTPEQRSLVVDILEFLLEDRSAEIEKCFNSDELIQAMEIWTDRRIKKARSETGPF